MRVETGVEAGYDRKDGEALRVMGSAGPTRRGFVSSLATADVGARPCPVGSFRNWASLPAGAPNLACKRLRRGVFPASRYWFWHEQAEQARRLDVESIAARKQERRFWPGVVRE